jgi:hypothetical protein
MARPGAEILLTQEVGDGTTWEILKAEAYYAITYKEEPIGIRITRGSMTGNGHIYKKMTYTNLGNARAQVNRLNHRFKTEDFSVMIIE